MTPSHDAPATTVATGWRRQVELIGLRCLLERAPDGGWLVTLAAISHAQRPSLADAFREVTGGRVGREQAEALAATVTAAADDHLHGPVAQTVELPVLDGGDGRSKRPRPIAHRARRGAALRRR